MQDSFYSKSHRRYNILTGEWTLVSPHRTKRPWQGKEEDVVLPKKESYDPNCYLCPTNTRANGEVNPDYKDVYSFENDFAALLKDVPSEKMEDGFLKAETETGICKVICFSPDHSLTLPLMEVEDIKKVVDLWKKEYQELGAREEINYIQIFENKGAIMGCSNPHPHGQIWAQSSMPDVILKKTEKQQEFWKKTGKSLLQSYLQQELKINERILVRNDHFVALIPFWAVWPYEVMIAPLNHYQDISQLNELETKSYADIIKKVTVMYDNLFKTSFPYSAGIHQKPTDDAAYEGWHFHMSFFPPLLRSATVKKFMVGYEMFATPQRDITPEVAVETLLKLPKTHFSLI